MYDFRNIPQTLKEIDSWVVWYKAFYQGKLKKNPVGVPVEEWTADWNAYPIRSYREAKEMLWQYHNENPSVSYGLGFALNMNHPVVGIDLDSVLSDDGQMNPVSQEYVMPIVEQAKKDNCYTEYSVSGTGLHIYGISKHKNSLFSLNTDGVIHSYFTEIYYATSHLVVTGDALTFPKELHCIDDTLDVAMEQIQKINRDFYLKDQPKDKAMVLMGYGDAYDALPGFQACFF